MRRVGILSQKVFVVVVALTLCGCAATTPMMPERADVAAKRFMPTPHKTNLYITRTSNLGFAILFKLYLDGELAGSIAPNTYLLFEPGVSYHINFGPEKYDIGAGNEYFWSNNMEISI